MADDDELNRTERSLHEIDELPSFDGSAIVDHLRLNGSDLSAETLVYALRECSARGHVAGSDAAARLLLGRPVGEGHCEGGRCESTIRSVAAMFGVADDSRRLDEFRQRVYRQLVEQLLAGREERPFWEERFHKALRMLAIDVGRSIKRTRDRHVSRADEKDNERTDITSVDPSGPGDPETDIVASLGAQTIRSAVRKLPEKQRTAAWLTWVKGYQVQSKDPATPTVSDMMDISPSMIRRYLRRARTALRENPKVKAIVEDFR